MSFVKVDKKAYPTRQWTLVGPPAAGKSTFATQMRGPLLVIDADHRFSEVACKTSAEIYRLSENPADNVNVEKIVQLVREGMKDSDVRTMIVDSLTSIITPIVTEALLDNEAGRNKNRVSAFKDKAMAMRHIQDGLTGFGTDMLWIYHFRDSLNANKKPTTVTNTSITAVELARLRRSLNMQLSVVIDGNRRGIKVDWARGGRSGMTLWDTTGSFIGMPERIEHEVYDDLTEHDLKKINAFGPDSFSGPQEAIGWAFEKGCFNDAVHAKNAYDELKRERQPKNAQQMWTLWVAEVKRRYEEWERDTAIVATPEIKQEEDGDILFDSRFAPKPIKVKVQNGESLQAAATLILSAPESVEPALVVNDENGNALFVADPREDFVFDIIPSWSSAETELANGLSNVSGQFGENEPLAPAKLDALVEKINALCDFTNDDRFLDVRLGEWVLRILAYSYAGPISTAFALRLNGKITEKIGTTTSPNFKPAVVALVKKTGQLTKEKANANRVLA
jgi:hypothetical protein